MYRVVLYSVYGEYHLNSKRNVFKATIEPEEAIYNEQSILNTLQLNGVRFQLLPLMTDKGLQDSTTYKTLLEAQVFLAKLGYSISQYNKFEAIWNGKVFRLK